jgi:quercetin dioxygenase-like cupin family protein
MFGSKSDNGYMEVLNGIKIKTLNYGRDTLMTEFLLKKDSILLEHAHINEQTGYLVKGRMRLFIDGSSRIVTPGDSWNVPSNAKHKAEVIEDSVAIEVFSPGRNDYMKYVYDGDIID